MNAQQFIDAMRNETQGNTDIAASTWAAMRRIAAHYEECEDCRDAFDDMEYDDETLLELAERIEQTEEADWVC